MNGDLFGDAPSGFYVVPAPAESATNSIADSAINTSATGEFDELPAAAELPPSASPAESKTIAVGETNKTDTASKEDESTEAIAPVAINFEAIAAPSVERILEVLAAHGVTDNLPAGSLGAIRQLVTEAQNAPAGLPPADRVLCWVMDEDLSKFAPTRVLRALDPYAKSNGQRMYPLYVPAAQPSGA